MPPPAVPGAHTFGTAESSHSAINLELGAKLFQHGATGAANWHSANPHSSNRVKIYADGVNTTFANNTFTFSGTPVDLALAGDTYLGLATQVWVTRQPVVLGGQGARLGPGPRRERRRARHDGGVEPGPALRDPLRVPRQHDLHDPLRLDLQLELRRQPELVQRRAPEPPELGARGHDGPGHRPPHGRGRRGHRNAHERRDRPLRRDGHGRGRARRLPPALRKRRRVRGDQGRPVQGDHRRPGRDRAAEPGAPGPPARPEPLGRRRVPGRDRGGRRRARAAQRGPAVRLAPAAQGRARPGRRRAQLRRRIRLPDDRRRRRRDRRARGERRGRRGRGPRDHDGLHHGGRRRRRLRPRHDQRRRQLDGDDAREVVVRRGGRQVGRRQQQRPLRVPGLHGRHDGDGRVLRRGAPRRQRPLRRLVRRGPVLPLRRGGMSSSTGPTARIRRCPTA